MGERVEKPSIDKGGKMYIQLKERVRETQRAEKRQNPRTWGEAVQENGLGIPLEHCGGRKNSAKKAGSSLPTEKIRMTVA